MFLIRGISVVCESKRGVTTSLCICPDIQPLWLRIDVLSISLDNQDIGLETIDSKNLDQEWSKIIGWFTEARSFRWTTAEMIKISYRKNSAFPRYTTHLITDNSSFCKHWVAGNFIKSWHARRQMLNESARNSPSFINQNRRNVRTSMHRGSWSSRSMD